MSKPLRDSMPTVTAFIDECRAAFGTEIINQQIRNGMHGSPTFYACENNTEAGTKIPEPTKFITGDQIVIRTDAEFSRIKTAQRKK